MVIDVCTLLPSILLIACHTSTFWLKISGSYEMDDLYDDIQYMAHGLIVRANIVEEMAENLSLVVKS